MSKTYKDIRKWKTKKFWDDYYSNRDRWDSDCSLNTYSGLSGRSLKACIEFVSHNKEYTNHNQLYTDYSGAPSWFTRLFSNIPKRREEKMLIKKIIKDTTDADKHIFPLARKPFAYYW